MSSDGSTTNPPTQGTTTGSTPTPTPDTGSTPSPAPAPAPGGSAPTPVDPPPAASAGTRPRVVVLTDLNNTGGDPDDMQSLLHLLWYADQLDIVGIVPDAWGGGGVEQTRKLVSAYEADYFARNWGSLNYPTPATMLSRIATNSGEAVAMINREAAASNEPLYVLIWGGLQTLNLALNQRPDLASRLRVLTIASNVKYEGGCAERNWNSTGRDAVFNDSRFSNLWWIESDWTYNGMFIGSEPRQMLNTLSGYGSMGSQMAAVVAGSPGLQYFRAGDTPTVLYLIDPSNQLTNPAQGSWAGAFTRPFPSQRPNYWTDVAGDSNWNYQNPCASWPSKERKFVAATATLQQQRGAMYTALLNKLARIYR